MMLINNERIEEICDLASVLGEQYYTDIVDPLQILHDHDVLVATGDFGRAFDGLLEWEENSFCVYLNDNSSSDQRMRFTAGHESGHYFIDEHRHALQYGVIAAHPSKTGFVTDNVMEREADIFSSYLLMPRDRFKNAARRVPEGLEGVCQLADKFYTSISCTAMRYINDHLIEGVVVWWNKNGVGRWAVSDEWWSIGRKRVIRSADAVTVGSATYDVMNGKLKNDLKIVKKGSLASEWFPGVWERSYQNDILIEEAMSLGRYGYLTLLYPDRP